MTSCTVVANRRCGARWQPPAQWSASDNVQKVTGIALPHAAHGRSATSPSPGRSRSVQVVRDPGRCRGLAHRFSPSSREAHAGR
jgi:hypothetical protein